VHPHTGTHIWPAHGDLIQGVYIVFHLSLFTLYIYIIISLDYELFHFTYTLFLVDKFFGS